MTTDFSYKVNYGAPASSAPTVDPNASLFASEDGTVASLSNSECIFQVRRSGATHVMTFQVLQALDQSREFRTLDEHAARIVATITGLQSQRDNVVRVLESLIARGLLLSDRDFLQRLSPVGAPAPPVAMRAVFIRACDRPAQLGRLLASLADYERRYSANRHYVLLDDSRSAAAANQHRDLLREFARGTGCKLTYVGGSERSRLAERLARAVPSAAGIVPHLLGHGTGSRFGGGGGWNLALLLSAGSRLVLLDDDHVLPLRRPDGARTGIDPNPLAQPTTQFFRNMENAMAAGDEIDEDPFEMHLEAAGEMLGSLITRDRYSINRRSLAGLPLSRLDHLQGNARILTTHQGAYGSSRAESGTWLYQLSAADRAAFVADRDAYLRNVETGSIWYGHAQACPSAMATFTPFALDNSVMLPCTNAQGRGEDALFSRVTELCHPDTLMLELPVAIGHVQEAQRKRSPLTMAAQVPRFNYFVSDFVQRQLPQFHARDPDQRLRLVAAHLEDVANASDSGRTRQLQEYLAYSRADLIERVQQQFDGAQDAPVYWKADVRSIIEANGRALISNGAPRLADWPDGIDESTCATLMHDECATLAAAYAGWPALWTYARDQGERLLATV